MSSRGLLVFRPDVAVARPDTGVAILENFSGRSAASRFRYRIAATACVKGLPDQSRVFFNLLRPASDPCREKVRLVEMFVQSVHGFVRFVFHFVRFVF